MYYGDILALYTQQHGGQMENKFCLRLMIMMPFYGVYSQTKKWL